MRVHLINSKQEIRKLWNNRPAQNEGPMIFVYSLPFIIVGGLLTLGEMHLWNSMIVFIPGIFLFSVITIIGAILMVAGFLTMIFGKQ